MVSQTTIFKLILAAMLAAAACRAQAPVIGSCPVFPANNIWNARVDQLPVAGNSSTYVNTIGSGVALHPDFGTVYNGAPNGIPYITVTGSQTKYPATFQYSDESDPGPYAVPLNAPIEGGSKSKGDRHVISIDTTNCILYELYAAYPQTSNWQAGSGAIYDLKSNNLRPAGWTSADAAGLPIFPGLVRYDEVLAGAINHAIRLTIPHTQDTYIWPARHEASTLTGTNYPPMGVRFRLKEDFDISTYSAANQVILTALKKYGMIVADNGTAWYISGAPDSRWSDDDLHNLGKITGTDFEAVDVSSLMVNPNTGQAGASASASTGGGQIGIYRDGSWVLNTAATGIYSPSDANYAYGGMPGDIPVFGDWTGDGKTKIGIYRNGTWILDTNGNGQWDSTDAVFQYGGLPGDVPVVGDWSGNGISKIGVYRGGVWILDTNGNGQWSASDAVRHYGGLAGDIPVVGDWNGSGTSKIGVYRNGTWILDTNGNGQWDVSDGVYSYGGLPGDVPVVGKWNGSNKSLIGVYRSGTWILDSDGNFAWSGSDTSASYGGLPDDSPIIGKF